MKYIPKKYDDLLIDNKIINILNNFSLNILLYSAPGCGKTATIKTFINENKDKYKIKVLNISDDRGIDLIRNNVLQFINNTDVSEKKIIILDEMDSLTVDAQNMLNTLMETKNTKFIFICNYINNISESIISKCCCIRINNIDDTKLRNRLKFILKEEQINISDISLELIILHYKKDIRKILNLFESLKYSYIDNVFIDINMVKKQLNY